MWPEKQLSKIPRRSKGRHYGHDVHPRQGGPVAGYYPSRLQDEDVNDLNAESNEFDDNLVEGLNETDDALLATLHLGREELVNAWRTVVRRMARKLATISDANNAEAKVQEIDQKIAMVKKLSQSEQSMDEDSTDKAEKKGL
ncbi:hypothetical protein BGZ70_006326 [Mortierella alpina]|uniref:Uncharacterized protein n=1 Tax=Mortierella alpina TaxID=64518 RepID=A0A9P6JA53_MORAP|nr:hypothetical protein BGZ70_006326 [Mortierella alpina]